MEPKKRHGAYNKRIKAINDIKEPDLVNPNNFFLVLQSEDGKLRKWMQDRGLIVGPGFKCPRCDKICT